MDLKIGSIGQNKASDHQLSNSIWYFLISEKSDECQFDPFIKSLLTSRYQETVDPTDLVS